MIWFNDLKLFIKLLFIRKFVWPELPESGFTKNKLVISDDKVNSNTFYSTTNLDSNLPNADFMIPQYAIYRKNHFIKIPCIIMQAEGNGRAYLIGYKNLLNGENGAGWYNEFQFLGNQRLPKKKW